MGRWKATIIWTTGHGDNVSELIKDSHTTAKCELIRAERKLRKAGARIRITTLWREDGAGQGEAIERASEQGSHMGNDSAPSR